MGLHDLGTRDVIKEKAGNCRSLQSFAANDTVEMGLKRFSYRHSQQYSRYTFPTSEIEFPLIDVLTVYSWMPQIDILCHRNVKVFMSHGGLMGTSEGVYCQKPTIVTPIYGDQFLNAAALEARGMGIILHYNQLSKDSIVDAVQRILNPRSVEATVK